jgi:acylphosphatase
MAAAHQKVARRYFVRGRVQGVCFRGFVQKQANEIGMTGYARNLDDGRVEVYAIGTPAEHDQLKGYLWKGPALADVRGVDEQEAALEKSSGFRVKG